MAGEPKSLTYTRYLALDELLAAQRPTSGEHDEMLFIVIHQVYELWFKQILHEIGRLDSAFQEKDLTALLTTFKRVLTILKTLVAQVDVLETMSPISFLSFRERLESASGFQSAQFRRIEIKLGKRDPRLQALFPDAFAEPPLYERFLDFLAAKGIDLSDREAALIDVYRHHHDLASLCERMVDLDEGLQEWRYRHVRMVERTIGMKRGTGGSAGAEYLRTTLFQPLFPDLWAIRTAL